MVAGLVAFFAFGIGLEAVIALRVPELKMSVSPVKVLVGALVAGAVALMLGSWAERHRRARAPHENAATTSAVKLQVQPLAEPTPKQDSMTTASAVSAQPISSLDVIKAQLLQLLRQPRVLQSTMRFQRSDLVMALEQQGFRSDHSDLESLVEEAVNSLLEEGRLEEQGMWVRARL